MPHQGDLLRHDLLTPTTFKFASGKDDGGYTECTPESPAGFPYWADDHESSPASPASSATFCLAGPDRRKIANTRSIDTTNSRLSCSSSTGMASRGSNSTLSYCRMVRSSSFSMALLIAITRPVMTG